MSDTTWIEEVSHLWPGQKFSLEIEKTLFRDKSPYQDVRVYQSKTYGTVLTLDGIIQCTERDEASYSEMLVHLPLCALSVAPKKVLVVGGGDGGVVREINKYKSVESIDVAEIDQMVIDVSKKYLPKMGPSFDDPRVQLNVCDGCAFVQNAKENSYDAVIIDSSDPVGPAVELYKRPFFEAIHRVLKPGGVVSSTAECVWLHLNFIGQVAASWTAAFVGGSVSYAYICTPSYPWYITISGATGGQAGWCSGQIGVFVAMKQSIEGEAPNPLVPQKLHFEQGASSERSPMQFYNAKMHEAAFALPEFARAKLSKTLSFQ